MPQPCRRYRRLSLPKKGSYSLGVAIGRVYTRRCRLAADIGGYLAWFYVQVGFPCTTPYQHVREQAGGYYRLLNLGTIYQTSLTTLCHREHRTAGRPHPRFEKRGFLALADTALSL